MKKLILTLVFVMVVMGLSAAARAETPDWMNPDSPLALGLHPRLLFIPQGYRDTHPDAFGITVSEMRDKLLSDSGYIKDFQNLVNEMDKVFNEDLTSKTKIYATYDAVNYAFLYIMDPSIMSQPPYSIKFSHSKDEYGDKAIEHAVYIATQLINIKVFTKDGDGWGDYMSLLYSASTSNGIANISIAIVNDWLNDKVTKTQKQLFMDGIMNVYNLRWKIQPFASAKHYGVAQNGDAGILGIYGDDIDNSGESTYQNYSNTLLDSLNTDWLKGFIGLGNKVYTDSVSSIEGPGYGEIATWNIAPMISIMSTALNKNYFAESTYLRYLPYSNLYLWIPMPLETGQNRWVCIDDMGDKCPLTRQWGRNMTKNAIVYGLKKEYNNLASLMQWFTDNVTRGDDATDIRLYYTFYKLIMGNRDVVPKSPAEINAPFSIRLGNGDYFLRTGFKDQNDTMIVFLATKYYASDGGHAHRDFATFWILKHADLATDREIAKGFAGGNIMITQQSMFYNTIGVLNPEAPQTYNTMGYRGGYDNYALDPDAPAWAENGANHVGSVKAEDLNGVDYDYIDYDYSNSWTPSWQYTQKVDYAEREFVYLRPAGGTNDEYVVVFDRINSVDPGYTKYWLLQPSFEPRLLDNNSSELAMTSEDYPNDADKIGGGRWVNKSSSPNQDNIIEITNTWNGHGRLFNKTLFPESFQINKTGGPGHYWEDAEGKLIYPGHVAGDSYSKYSGVVDFATLPQVEKNFHNKYYSGNPGPDGKYYYLTDSEKNYRGTYTMQIQSTTGQKFDNFLNVIQFGDSNTLTQMNPASRIDADMMVGAFIDDPHSPRVVLFSQDQKGASVQSVRYKANYFAILTGKHLLVDMKPGKYDVYKNGVKGHSDLSALDKKGTLYFEASGDSTQEESKESLFQVVRTGEIPAPITITGDINADGAVNVLDLQLCVNVVLGISPPFAASPLPNWAWDANNDGKIDGNDVDGIEAVIVERTKAVANPLGECNVLDLQAVVNEILNSG